MIKNNEDSIEINYSISRVIAMIVAAQSYYKIVAPAVKLASRVPIVGISTVTAVTTGALLTYQLYSKTNISISSVLSLTPIGNDSKITINKAKVRSIKSRFMKTKIK